MIAPPTAVFFLPANSRKKYLNNFDEYINVIFYFCVKFEKQIRLW